MAPTEQYCQHPPRRRRPPDVGRPTSPAQTSAVSPPNSPPLLRTNLLTLLALLTGLLTTIPVSAQPMSSTVTATTTFRISNYGVLRRHRSYMRCVSFTGDFG